MEKTNENTNQEVMEFLEMSPKITQKEIEAFLNEKGIKFSNVEFVDNNDKKNVKVTFTCDALTYTQIELLKGQAFPKHDNQIIKIYFIPSSDTNVLIIDKHPKEDSEIEYEIEYDKLLHKEYERKFGSDGLVFTNDEVINKQRSVAGYLVKKIGLNLIKGKSIMNVSLPLTIFDTRSILELFAWQHAYAYSILDQAGTMKDPIEKIKYTTAFAVSKFNLSGAQLKPFNPILGETFQCKLDGTSFYFEQTCHHPPVLNFYGIGKNYKIYGYNESEASTGANSVKVNYNGNIVVEYPDGSKQKVIFPTLKIAGTMIGARMLKFRGKLIVVDEANDLISQILLDPDDRGFLKKLTTKKQTYPDYFKGIITNLSKNAKFDKKEKNWSVTDNSKHILSNIEGEFTNHLKFDGDIYWEHGKIPFPKFRRMAYTLPSDSTFREDLVWLKKKDEDMAQKFKVRLEEIQRNDKKLREVTKTQSETKDTSKTKKK